MSLLFAIWSTVGFVAEVPSGALADRFSRRGALVVSGLAQAVGFGVWIALPGFAGFAAGFVLWGLGGTLASGAFEALLYDGLAAVHAEEHYGRINGRAVAAGLVAQVPAALGATVLFTAGGYAAAGWVSVGLCVAAAALATRFPEPPRTLDDEDGPGYLATLRAGTREAAASPAVRAAVVAVALLTGLDALEEYFGIVAVDRGVPTALVPLATLAIPLAGAAGAALGGAANRLPAAALAGTFALGLVMLGVAGIGAHPAGLVAVTAFYGLYRMVSVRRRPPPGPDRRVRPGHGDLGGRARHRDRVLRGLRNVGARRARSDRRSVAGGRRGAAVAARHRHGRAGGRFRLTGSVAGPQPRTPPPAHIRTGRRRSGARRPSGRIGQESPRGGGEVAGVLHPAQLARGVH